MQFKEMELGWKPAIEEPGQFYERNYFPDDIDFLNEKMGGRIVFIDNATQKDFEAVEALEPLQNALTEDGLTERVIKLHRDGWIVLMTNYDEAEIWRGLLGRALYKQMKNFRTFFGITKGEQRYIHFFMMKKTPEFKRNIRKFKNMVAGEFNDDTLGTPIPPEVAFKADYLKRLSIIAVDPATRGEEHPGGTINFMGCAKEAAPELLSNLLKVVLE